ncbi:MAG TPA: hypothetical protein VIH47_00845 [Solirubrobacterales bacterium]
MALLGALVLAAPAGAATCQEEGSSGTGPVFSEVSLTPANLPSEGGTGQISVRVADDCAIQRVIVEVASTEGFYVGFELLPIEEDINTYHRIYRGAFQIPANYQEWSVGYQVSITATDTDGAFGEVYAGEIDVEGVPQFDEPPYIYEPSARPHTFGGSGGTARIGVTATDLRGVANAYAIVTYPNNSEKEVWLEPVSATRFEGSLKLPGNPGGAPRVYSVSVFAEDDIGQRTGGYAGTITVEPNGTPSPGFLLSLLPKYWRFGSVKIGAEGLHEVVLQNGSKVGTGAVSGFIRTSGPPYFLPGAGPEGIPFTLKPGEQQTFGVNFRPISWGRQNGRLMVVRTDGNQPNLGISLFGWGSR